MLRPLCIALLGLLLTWRALAEDAFSIGGDADFPPSSWSYRDQLHGVGPTLVRAALQERGLESRVDPRLPWQRALLMLQQGELDILTSVYRTPEREAVLRFVPEPYLDDRIEVWITRQPQPAVSALDQLRGKRGLMIIGYSGGQQFDRWAQQQPLSIQRVSSIAQCFAMLRAGRADYLIYSRQVGEAWVKRLGYEQQFSTLAEAVAIEPLFIAVSPKPEHAWLVDYLGQKIRQYKRSGRLDGWLQQELARFRQQGEDEPLDPAPTR